MIFKGDGHGNFTDKSIDWGTAAIKGYHTGASYADLDRDGDLDVVINAVNASPTIYRNNLSPGKYISIVCKGDGGNRFGTGTKVWLFSRNLVQYQQLQPTRGFQSASEPVLHFGYPDSLPVDSILIVWPDQRFELVRGVPPKSQFVADKKNASGEFRYNTFFPKTALMITEVTNQFKIPWIHMEDAFDDFNNQPLIPHRLSTRGPKLQVADINNDGLDDFFVCGARGQPGILMNRSMSLSPSRSPAETHDLLDRKSGRAYSF